MTKEQIENLNQTLDAEGWGVDIDIMWFEYIDLSGPEDELLEEYGELHVEFQKLIQKV